MSFLPAPPRGAKPPEVPASGRHGSYSNANNNNNRNARFDDLLRELAANRQGSRQNSGSATGILPHPPAVPTLPLPNSVGQAPGTAGGNASASSIPATSSARGNSSQHRRHHNSKASEAASYLLGEVSSRSSQGARTGSEQIPFSARNIPSEVTSARTDAAPSLFPSAVDHGGQQAVAPSSGASVPAGSIGVSPEVVLEQHGNFLSPYERQEIRGFPNVYYYGKDAKKVMAAAPSSSGITSSHNYGYDDENCDYKVVIDDHIMYRYQILSELGRGSFGQVSRALDHKTGRVVALKIIKNKKKFHEQALIEVNILRTLRDRDPEQNYSVVRILDSFIFRSHMMITFELHGMNLYELCKAVKFNPLPMATIKMVAQQLLGTLHFCRALKIVHCDLKPENVLLVLRDRAAHLPTAGKQMLVAGGSVDLLNPIVRVIDFGSSCYESKRLYTYIQSRFYRAPEIMLGIPYTTAIDMWSFGCILAELANGYPIFPGENERDQMQAIMEYLGVPPRDLLDRAPRKKNFFDANTGNPILTPNRKGKIKRPMTKDVSSFLRSAAKERDVHFADFILRCLEWDPAKRWTPEEAASHPWMQAASAANKYSAPPEPNVLLPRINGRR